jgi:hypothetical protein
MNFRRVNPTPEYRSLRLISEEGRWELGLSEYHTGTRLLMGLAGRPPSVLDFCMGHDSKIYFPILLAVINRLAPLPVSANTKEIDCIFPWAGTRPDLSIHLKPLLDNLWQTYLNVANLRAEEGCLNRRSQL